MKNTKMSIKGNVLTIEIDLSVTGEESKSGKSVVLASTEGNVDAPGGKGVKVGLNVYKPKSAK